LNAAGFFMTRGIKWFGWIFILGAIGMVVQRLLANSNLHPQSANLTMGFFFGVLHLAYGAYLYLTEKRKNAA
jgi:ABC-type spermidine/putrescine transport system permease subunit I